MPLEHEAGIASAFGLTFGLSMLHAALPNHWLPFVLVGRSLKWSRRRTLSVLALAGGGHVLSTSALGLGVWWLGDSILRRFSHEDVERWGGTAAGSLLCGLGVVYLLLHFLGRHGHSHAGGALLYGHEDHGHAAHDHHHDHPTPGPGPGKLRERGAILTLFLALTFSPCEAVAAAFLGGVRFGFGYVLLLAIGASLATVAAMFVLTWLTLAGFDRLRFPWLDRNEMSLTGVLLVLIGVVVLTLPT